ncbi:hypothetical protein LSAT2_015870 [Lamellibrachia satsuma]|nr:hypothetical protein LSAT2_015870 [Lamellibrachia satsuma]
MSITFGLLAVVALTVVLRCSAVAGDASWTTFTKCLENELNNSTKDTLECVKIQMFVQFTLMKYNRCGPCSSLFHCQAGSNAVRRCGNDDLARNLVTVVSECVDIVLTSVYKAAILYGQSGGNCTYAYGCRIDCQYSPAKGFCAASNCK